MRTLFFCALLLACLYVPHASAQVQQIGCVACVVGVFAIHQDVINNQQSIEHAVQSFCDSRFNGTWVAQVCDAIISAYGNQIIHYLLLSATPDQVCQNIGVCTNHSCNLYPPSVSNTKLKAYAGPRPSATRDSPWQWLENIINRVFNQHLPLEDLDNDYHAQFLDTFRGADWRGRDCNDIDPNAYPGIRSKFNPLVDDNCNGISGANSNGQSWEQVLCGSSQPRGVVVLGDSASAHFHVPLPNTTDPAIWLRSLEDELDAPACSWATGHRPTAECPSSPLASGVDSIYLRIFQRNRCNFGDYQNIAVNGARSSAMNTTIVRSLARNQRSDVPAIVFYALVGNDVCNRYWDAAHPGSDHMTTPPQFLASITSTLQYLDTKLPNGSFVFFIGLEDGLLIWDTLAAVTHPLLQVSYARLWEFISCYNINPCWGWLNPDPTWRNFTQTRAQNLNAVFPQIVASQKYRNFDMAYLGNFLKSNLDNWVKSGGQAKDMFEIVDGGHPSQLAHELDAAAIWAAVEAKFPQALGPVNPNNALIDQLFGNKQKHN